MRHSKYIILIILGIIVLLSSCSLFPSEIDRNLFFDSICWEDDNHILMYTMVRKWVNTTGLTITGSSGYWDWSQGEIWRINVLTGEKELLLRREGDKYTGLSTVVKIDVLGDRKLISLDGNAYIMEGESANWREILGIYEAEWVNNNEIIGIEEETGDIVKYDLENETQETIREESEVDYFSCNTDLSKIILTKYGFDAFQLINDTDYQIVYHDTIMIKDNEITSISCRKGYILNNNQIGVKFSAVFNEENERNRGLLVLDSTLATTDLIYIDGYEIIPNKDISIFLKHYFDESNIEVYDSDLNKISTIGFSLNTLD